VSPAKPFFYLSSFLFLTIRRCDDNDKSPILPPPSIQRLLLPEDKAETDKIRQEVQHQNKKSAGNRRTTKKKMPPALPTQLSTLLLRASTRATTTISPATTTTTTHQSLQTLQSQSQFQSQKPQSQPNRSFSTTPSHPYRQRQPPNTTLPIPSVTAPIPTLPPYPPGPHQVYHQSNTGLYGTSKIRFGNKVSSKNEIKTRRAWRPNVHHKRLWSESLATFVRTRITTRVLRTVDKVGGLDAYLLGIKAARIKELGPWGWRLRWRIMQSPALRKKLNEEREKFGLPLLPVHVDGTAAGGGAAATAVVGLEGMGGIDEKAAATMMEETTRMLENEEEFAIGEEAEVGDNFMREEPNKA
jgi:large subunit ribosomal protein L28